MWGRGDRYIDPLCEDNTVSPKINTKYLHGSVTVKRLRRCMPIYWILFVDCIVDLILYLVRSED